MLQSIPLSKLVAARKNPRRVKPQAEAHRRLVASIKAFGLLEPLIVRPMEGDGQFQVVAGCRRLAALKEVYRGSKQDPKIGCDVRKVEDSTAEALSLSENFVREAMHPLDEAETFARLAGEEGKDADAIAAQFGVTPRYVRQRMKLATLVEPIQAAYREDKIDTATAEVFTAVPPERQLELWKALRGAPRHAEQVRNMIHNGWIDAAHALFDIGTLSPAAVSRDLFSERVLVERSAFMAAQTKALAAQRQALVEEGWAEAVVGAREDVQDRLYVMDTADRHYDKETAQKLAKLESQRQKLEAKANKLDEDDGDAELNAIQEEHDALEEQAKQLVLHAPPNFAEATKAVGTAFLILDPDGQVRREYRVPRQRPKAGGNDAGAGAGIAPEPAKPPTSDNLSDRQLAETFAQQTLAVREALLGNAPARQRILAMILHDKVRSEALAIRHDANGVTLHASNTEGFTSAAFDKLRKMRAELDPLNDGHHCEDADAYAKLAKLPEPKLDALIDLLAVECLTSHALRRTELVHRLATELGVDFRKHWGPDAAWLAGFQKSQLAHLLAQFRGPSYSPDHEQRKKSELVAAIAQLFADAATGKLEDKKLAQRVNAWLPANLRGEGKEGK